MEFLELICEENVEREKRKGNAYKMLIARACFLLVTGLKSLFWDARVPS